jgi:hypothetical protein
MSQTRRARMSGNISCESWTHLDVLNPELDLPESLVLLLVQVTEGELHNSSLQGVVGVLCKTNNRSPRSALHIPVSSC